MSPRRIASVCQMAIFVNPRSRSAATSADPDAWQVALDAIRGRQLPGRAAFSSPPEHELSEWVSDEDRLAISAFAKGLGIEVRDVLAACHPRAIAPYIFLNE